MHSVETTQRGKTCFSKVETNVLKGVAIIMMMWHHGFSSGKYDGYEIVFFPLGEDRVVRIAAFLKICVTLFAFISGYGLYLSYQRDGKQLTAPRWIGKRLVKVLSGYWLVFVISLVVCQVIDQYTAQRFFSDGIYQGVVKLFLEFFGLTNLFGQSNFNGTWWYMSAAVMFVVLAPLCFEAMKKYGTIACVLVMIAIPRLVGEGYPGSNHFFTFLPAFYMGGVFARYQLFDRFHNWTVIKHMRAWAVLKCLCLVVGCLLCYKMSVHLKVSTYWELNYGLLVIPLILFIVEYVAKIPLLKQILAFLGKHSANIFMVHSFIRWNYGTDFVYKQGNFFMALVLLLSGSLVISLVLEQCKKLISYDKWMDKLVECI